MKNPFDSLDRVGVCGSKRLKLFNLQCFSLRSTDYATRSADVRLSSCAAHYSRFLWRQCVPLHFTSFWRRSHWTSITKFMSKHKIGPFCLIGTQRGYLCPPRASNRRIGKTPSNAHSKCVACILLRVYSG